MNFENLKNHIDAKLGGHPFVKSARLEWHQELDRLQGEFVLVVETRRLISLEGGNGWDGLDAKDADALRAAIQDILIEEGAIGRVKRFIIH